MIKYLFEFFVKEEYLNQFQTELDRLKKTSLEERGCVVFDYIKAINCFIIIEYWENIEDFNMHFIQKNTLIFREKISPMLSCPRLKYEIRESK